MCVPLPPPSFSRSEVVASAGVATAAALRWLPARQLDGSSGPLLGVTLPARELEGSSGPLLGILSPLAWALLVESSTPKARALLVESSAFRQLDGSSGPLLGVRAACPTARRLVGTATRCVLNPLVRALLVESSTLRLGRCLLNLRPSGWEGSVDESSAHTLMRPVDVFQAAAGSGLFLSFGLILFVNAVPFRDY